MDIMSAEKRSMLMSKIRSKNTKPEMQVRSLLHALGYRFRLHRKDLPGSPDIVLPGRKTVIFVHGCFWHRHEGCPKTTMPATNRERWEIKFKKNTERDQCSQDALRQMGWRVVIVWECEVNNSEKLVEIITSKLALHGHLVV